MDNQLKEKLYKIIIKEPILTTDVLINNNITKDNIQYLLDNKIIKEVSPDNYELIDIDSLYRYGIKLLVKSEYRLANNCFIKCYKLNPENRDICLQITLSALRRGNYSEVLKMFPILEKTEQGIDKKDNILYIYLLSLITKIDEEYQDLLINLNEFDLLLDKNDPNNQQENIIREHIIKRKYKRAISIINDQISLTKKYNPKTFFIKELLSQVINREQKFKKVLYYNIKDKKYYHVINYLEKKSEALAKEKREVITSEEDILKYLNQQEVRIYLITKKIIEIKETKIIPQINNRYPNNIDEAITANNYKAAKVKNINYLNRLNSSIENDLLHPLLEDINTLIISIKKEQLSNLKEELISHIEEPKTYTKKI